MADHYIELERDPVPIVRIIGSRLRRGMRRPDFRRRVERFRGSFALASDKDPQALTVIGEKSRLYIQHGIHENASIVIYLDFDQPGYSPRVEGFLRHPWLAWRVAKLLDFPRESWTDSVERFWEHACRLPRMPRAIKVVCDDDGREVVLGEGEVQVQIHGSAGMLADLFAGSSILVQSVMSNKIKVVGNLKHLAILSEATLQLMLGEIDGEH